MATINYYLRKTVEQFFIQHSSSEKKYIKERVTSFRKNLRAHFGKSVSKVLLFGSVTRGTNLPRELDSASDVDVLVVFDQLQGAYKPETYRNQLRRFAEEHYPRMHVAKSHPSVVLQMRKVMFDLVPARLQRGWFSEAYQIPHREREWIDTNPTAFSVQLAQLNKRHKSLVKPVVRLLKRWNAHRAYPFDSYELEQIIAGMQFWGATNLEAAFLSAIDQLSSRRYGLLAGTANQVEMLKKGGDRIRELLRKGEQDAAIAMVDKILGLVAV